jgi:rhodanese-related sulfurtransferase
MPAYLLAAETDYIKPADLEGMLAHQDTKTTIIDVRNRQRYNCYHLEGALNIAPRFIKDKTFLKDRDVILVDDGFNPCPALNLVRDLKKHGFKQVMVLAGGMDFWESSGRRVAGAGRSYGSYHAMLPMELQLAIACKEIFPIIVDLTDDKSGTKLELTGTVKIACAKGSEKQIISRIKNMQIEYGADDAWKRPVVLIDRDGTTSQGLVPSARAEGMHNVYFLKDGLSGWDNFNKEQRAPKILKKQKNCPDCPKK